MRTQRLVICVALALAMGNGIWSALDHDWISAGLGVFCIGIGVALLRVARTGEETGT